MARLNLMSVAAIALPLALAACGGADETDRPEGLDTGGVGDLTVDPRAEATELSWQDLIPDSDRELYAAMAEGTASPDLMSQFKAGEDLEQIGTYNAVESLDGQVIRMPGYILPIDYAQAGQAREFLLLPYHGACIHYPPPPPNQIVHIRSAEPIAFDGLWDPVWVEGRIEIETVSTDLADTAYSMAVRSVEPYTD